MIMFSDIVLNKASDEQMSLKSAKQVADFSKDVKPGHWCFIGPRSKQSWNYDTIADTREKWDAIAGKMTDIFAESGHPVFPAAET